MLKIKLSPIGKKHAHEYRIVVMEENSKLTSDVTALLGHYNPKSKDIKIDKKAVAEWIKKGAQPTVQIKQLLKI